MPVYLYKCKKCNREFEYIQSINSEPLTHCPNEVCKEETKGEGEVYRKISKNIGLVFNGSGFYLTDYVHKKENFSHSSNGKSTTTETKPAEAKPADNGASKDQNKAPKQEKSTGQ